MGLTVEGSVAMEPNGIRPKTKRVDPGTTRTHYQSPTITLLGGLEQVTLNTYEWGTGDTWTGDINGIPLNQLLASP